MAFSGGTFSRLYSWVTDAANGIKILASRMDEEMNGFATGLSTCITKDGQTTITANLPMSGFRHTGVGNASARDHYAAAGQVQDSSFIWCGTATGTKNALTLTPTPAIAAYATGQRFIFKSSTTASDDAVTVAISSLTAKAIQLNDAALSSTVVIEASKYYEILYDGTAFQISRLSSAISRTGADGDVVTGTAGTDGNLAQWNSDGDIVDGPDVLDEDDMASDSATAVPTQQSVKAYVDTGDLWGLIDSGTISDDAALSITFTAANYSHIVISINDFLPATDGANLILRTSTDGGANYDQGASDYAWTRTQFDTVATFISSAGDGADSAIQFCPAQGNQAGEIAAFKIEMFAPSTAKPKLLKFDGVFHQTSGNYSEIRGSGKRAASADVNGIQIGYNTGNIASGTYEVWALKAS